MFNLLTQKLPRDLVFLILEYSKPDMTNIFNDINDYQYYFDFKNNNENFKMIFNNITDGKNKVKIYNKILKERILLKRKLRRKKRRVSHF